MTTFAGVLTDDLRERAAFLLEAGKSEAGSALEHVAPPVRSISGALLAVSHLVSLLPGLLAEATERELSLDHLRRTSRPHQSLLPRTPSAYELGDDGGWSPRYWLEPEEVEKAALPALRWLMHLIGLLDSSVQELRSRAQTQLEEVRAARAGVTSHWSELELERVESLSLQLVQAAERLERLGNSVRSHTGHAVPPLSRLPRPFPAGRSWRVLRQLARFWLNPESNAHLYVVGLLSPPHVMADVPFLYERWCAIKVLDQLAARGWRARNDEQALWAVFLGGCVVTESPAGHRIELWVEPRIGSATHQSGLVATGVEQSPDLVINVPTRGGMETVVLDPTLASDLEHLRTKGRYLSTLRRAEARTIAGIRAVKSPRRSWAMAPLSERSCRLLEGATEGVGVIPMNPLAYDPEPLTAFLDDLCGWADGTVQERAAP